MKWLGLEHDVFVRQSDRVARHREALEELIRTGAAYVSKEEAKDGSGVIKEIVRFKNPNEVVTFHDEIRGDVSMDTSDLGDFVIAKNMEEPLFHLAVVVDDFDAGITHVIRGEDHTSNTPRQILIQRALGAPTPIYAHLPLVLGLDKQKLSKRKGALAVSDYRDLGYLSDALFNAATLVGWNPGTDQEIFSKDELMQIFDLSKVQKAGAVWNPEKLDWFNREYIKNLSKESQLEYIENFIPEEVQSYPLYEGGLLERILPVLIERISKFSDIRVMHEAGELSYFFQEPTYDYSLLIWKKMTGEEHEKKSKTGEILSHVSGLLASVSDYPTVDEVKDAVWSYAEELGRGDVLWPTRVALSGQEKSPDPFTLISIIGRNESISRIEHAVAMLS